MQQHAVLHSRVGRCTSRKKKGITHMAIALRNRQMLVAIIIVAFLTLMALSFTILNMEHINLWQNAIKLIPAASFGSM